MTSRSTEWLTEFTAAQHDPKTIALFVRRTADVIAERTGPLPDEVAPHFTHDLDAREKSVLIPVIAVILLFGFMPGPIMQLAEPTAKAAMQRMQLDDPVAPAKGEK